MLWKAKTIGQTIEEISTAAASSTSFQLHSRFANGFNLSSQHQLIYVGNDRKGTIPFGIHLSAADFDQIGTIHRPFYFERQRDSWLLTNQEYQIDLQTSKSFDGRLNRIKPENLKEKMAALSTYELRTGMDFSAELAGASPVFQRLFSTERTSLTKSFFYYIGRGIGLTPSGDDFLIGLLAIDQVFQFLSADFRPVLLELAAEGKWTTSVSNAYLTCACNNQFSSLIKNTIDALDGSLQNWQQAITDLADSGSTSGCDTLAGILAGANLYLRKGELNQ